jgi:acyl-CoA thioesterase I
VNRWRWHPVLASLTAVLLGLLAVWGVELLRLARSVEQSRQHWAQPRGETGGLLYVALGDSAAQGIGASSPDRGYVGLLAERLRDSTGGPVEVVNLSASGARIGDVLERQLPALAALGREPDVLTVGIGGNDVRAYDRAEFDAEVDRLMAALPAGAYVADAPYFMHGRWQRDAQHAADLLAAAARERGLRPVALHDAQRAQGWQAMLTHFSADWFHPNDRGHRVWADAFWAEIAADRPLPDG